MAPILVRTNYRRSAAFFTTEFPDLTACLHLRVSIRTVLIVHSLARPYSLACGSNMDKAASGVVMACLYNLVSETTIGMGIGAVYIHAHLEAYCNQGRSSDQYTHSACTFDLRDFRGIVI